MKRYSSFLQLLSDQKSDATALEYVESGEVLELTYGELVEKVKGFPIPEESSVGILCHNDLETILAIFALSGRKRVVLLGEEDAPETLQKQILATRVQKLYGNKELVGSLQEFLSKKPEEAKPSVLFFTSGTTSSAKAVCLSEESLCSAAYNGGALLPLKRDDVLLSVLPYSHVYGFVCSLLWPLSFGATVCLGRGLRSIFFDFTFFRPTASVLVPQMAGFLGAKRLFNPELKLVLIGAGDCDDATLALLKELGIRVSFGYGLTETSSGIALSLGENPREMTICPDYQVEIASDGEILVSSPTTLMEGYFEDEESTAAAKTGNVLYTGDLGELVDGKLFLKGRKKEILVFDDGTKLFLPEYEKQLAEVLGEGADFAVVQLKQAIILFIHKPRRVEWIVESFNQRFPRSHQIDSIRYLDEPLPRTKTGKIQRYLLGE